MPDCRLALFFSALALHSGAETREGGSGWSPPWDPAESLRWAPGPTLRLPCWTDIHAPAHISSIGHKGEWDPILSEPLSRASFPSPSARREYPHGPRPSALHPVWLWNRGRPLQSRLLLLSEKVLRTGCLLSPTFLFIFTCPCLTSLFGRNGKFSVPALPIYSYRMPSLKPKRLGLPARDKTEKIYYSNTVWLQYIFDNRYQWPETGTLDYNTLRDLSNFCCRNGQCLEITYVQAFFALHSWPSLCESCYTSQILLAHSGPRPPNTMSPDPCWDFSSSSFDPSDHSPPPNAPNPLAAAPGTVPQPPAYVPSPSLLLKCSSQLPSPASAWDKLWAPPSTSRVPRLHPDLPTSPPFTRSRKALKRGPSLQGPLPTRRTPPATPLTWSVLCVVATARSVRIGVTAP